jgi:hypothetical protein
MKKLKKLTLEQVANVMGGKFLNEPKNKEILIDLFICIQVGISLKIWKEYIEEYIEEYKDDHYGYSYTIQDLHNFLDKLNYIINP